MLRKMYLVSAENFSAPKKKSPPLVVSAPPKLNNSPPLSKTRQRKKQQQHTYDRWVKFRKNMGEAEITRKARMKAIADFLQKVLPEPSSHTETDAKKKKKKQPLRHFEVGTQTEVEAIPSTSASAALYETPKPRFTIGDISDDDDDDDDFVKGDTRASGRERENVGSIASPYILPYLSNTRRRTLDTRYGTRKDGDSFKIGDSIVLVDTDSNITIRGKEFRETTGLWELLTRKRVDRRKITTDDLKNYKKILELTHAHLTGYQAGADMQITLGSKYRDVIAPLFPHIRRRGIETALRRRWAKYCWPRSPPPPLPLADSTMTPPDLRRFRPCENSVWP